jgi:nucleoid DNA-binding protein
MIKNDIAFAVERKTNFSRADSLLIVDRILSILKSALVRREKVEIRGFGSFRVVSKKTGFGRDIRRGRQIMIEKGYRVKFRPGQELKASLNSKRG